MVEVSSWYSGWLSTDYSCYNISTIHRTLLLRSRSNEKTDRSIYFHPRIFDNIRAAELRLRRRGGGVENILLFYSFPQLYDNVTGTLLPPLVNNMRLILSPEKKYVYTHIGCSTVVLTHCDFILYNA